MFFEKRSLDDYVPSPSREESTGNHTEYIYQGNWIVWDCSVSRRKSVKNRCIFGMAATMILFLVSGTARCHSNLHPPVAVFSLLSMAALLFAFLGVCSFSWKQGRLPEYDFHWLTLKLQYGFLSHSVLIFLASLFSFLLAEAERSELFLIELRVAFGYLFCAGISFFLYRNVKSLSHHMEPGA